MKLSEVIKAKGKFKQGKHFEFIITEENLIIKFFNQTLFLKLEDDWEEVKPPRQWSEKELMLFKLLPDWAKWIATDKGSDDVFVFENKPEIENIIFFQNETDKHDYKLLEKEIFDFLTITFEESPIHIGDLKGE